MPLFFFDVRDGEYFPDNVGTDLPDLDAARREAVTFSGELLRDRGAKFWDGAEWRVEVKDAHGLMLFTLLFTGIDAPALRKPLRVV